MSKKTDADTLEGELKRIRDEFDYDFQKWDPIYKEGDIDVRFRAGHPWEDKDKRSREDAGRPALEFDELGQYLNDAVNDVRANPVSPKFSPTGDGANDDTARFYENLDRETEYRSDAHLANTTAYENCLERSYGFIRIKTEYEHYRSFNQQLAIDPLANPSAWYPDADAMRPDGSDWTRGSYIESYTRSEFKRKFPNARYQDFSREQIAVIGNKWGGEDRVQVAERWELNMKEGVLVQYEVPATRLKPQRIVEVIEGVERKPRGGVEVQRRPTEIPQVRSCFTTGLEILEQADGRIWMPWAGDMIPFASCYGKILWMNGGSGAERTILSMTRLARSPYMAYCFAVTSLIEAIGMITKNPYFAYEGTLDAKQLNAIAESLHQPVAVLFSKPFIPGLNQQLMPLLQKNPLTTDLSSYVQMAELCRQAIRSAMSVGYLPTPAQRNNEKSGVALDKINEGATRGAYHFKDSYYMMLRRGAAIRENLYDRIYDTPRDVNVRMPDDEAQQWRINDPKAEGDRVLKPIKGRHSVTIDIGPAEQSERDAADKFIDTFVASPLLQLIEPAKRDKLIGLAIKARNIGIMGDKIADVISPPENKTGQPDPAQAMALLQQAQQEIIPGLQQQIQELQQQIEAKVVESASREKIAAQADATKREIAGLQHQEKQAATAVGAETDVQIQTMRDEIERMWLKLEAMKISAQLAHERDVEGARLEQATVMAEQGRESASSEATAAREHASGEAAEDREHATGEAKEDRAATSAQLAQKTKATK